MPGIAALRHRNTAVFVAVSALTGFGSTAMQLTSGMWVFDLTGSSSLAGLLGFCIFAPTLVGPVLGAMMDRLPRRATLIATNTAMAAALLSLLLVGGAHDVWLLFAVMFAYGVTFVVLDAGEAAILPSTLPAHVLGSVNGLRMSAQEGMKILAPLVGAGLYAWRGGQPVAVVSAVVLLAAAGLYGLLTVAPRASPPGATRRFAVRAGLDFLRREPAIRATTAIAATTIAMSGFTSAAVYAVVADDLRLPSTFLGVLTCAQGVGSLVGGLVVGRLLTRHGEIAVGVLGAWLFAAGCLARCLPWWPAVLTGSVLIGLGLPWTLIAAGTAVQVRTPESLLGQVAGTASTLMFAPVAAATPAGAAAVLLGSRPSLLAAATACLVATALLGRRRSPTTQS